MRPGRWLLAALGIAFTLFGIWALRGFFRELPIERPSVGIYAIIVGSAFAGGFTVALAFFAHDKTVEEALSGV